LSLRAAITAALALCAAPAAAQAPDYAPIRAAEAAQAATALAAATRDLCGQRIVLLGENGFHGDGKTGAFKADLVRNLVTQCGFDAVVFEGSLYDFTALNRAIRRGDATPQMLASAMGGLWNQNREVQDLIGFLFGQARDGRVLLAGMDDQLGSRGAFYSLETMPLELAGFLPLGRREDCAVRLKQRIWSRYTAADPYDDASRAALRACLSEIDAVVATARLDDPKDRAEYRSLVAAFGRTLNHDTLGQTQRIHARDRDMARNVEALVDTLPADARVVVWTANSHAARDASAHELFGDQSNMGHLLDVRFGTDLFTVGFTAAGGSYRYTVREARPIPVAAPGSLEATALSHASDEVVWVGPEALSALPPTVGSAFDHNRPVTAEWGLVFDGLVVFRTERPPYRLDE
jgi:erythromycin esterase-like protein